MHPPRHHPDDYDHHPRRRSPSSSNPNNANGGGYRRQASLSEVERSVLSHLLVDASSKNPADEMIMDGKAAVAAAAVFNEDILFSLPAVGLIFSSSSLDDVVSSSSSSMPRDSSSSRRRRSSSLGGGDIQASSNDDERQQQQHPTSQSSNLWKAYHRGIIQRRRRRRLRLRRGEQGEEDKVASGATRMDHRTRRRFWQRKKRSSDVVGGGRVQNLGITNNDNEEEDDLNEREHPTAMGERNLVGKKHSTHRDDDNNLDDDDNNDSSPLLETNHDDDDIQSDNEVGTIHDESSASSWNSSQGGYDHFDAWEVLRDEYAPEFGYHVADDEEAGSVVASSSSDHPRPPDSGADATRRVDDDDDSQPHRPFKILGTSAHDASALPHVLSPPLMDSLLNFVPEHLWNCNYWLKYSLVRDGASLDILRRYCRAATHTVLAIETTSGDVFGSFTSSAWTCRRHRPSSSNTTGGGFYGTGESFLWRMRSNRNTPVHSLFEQAQLESDIDVFPYNGSNDYVQLCTRDMLALGGGGGGGGVSGSGGGGATAAAEQHPPQPLLDDDDVPPVVLEDIVNYGFGLALDKYLLHGTTSPSATFGNSNLTTSHRSASADDPAGVVVVGGGVTFDVKNLEVWGFTSANTVADAQKSEMSMYFARESISSSLTSLSSFGTSRNSFGGRSDHLLFEADDLSQDRFYRRIGRDDENEVDRTAWQYANMMNPVAGSSPYGNMGSSSPYGR